MPEAVEQEFVLPLTAESVARARTLLMSALEQHPLSEAGTERSLLAISELVTNAVLHTDEALVLKIAASPAGLQVEIADGSPTPPVLRTSAPDEIGGRGLAIVDAVADDWGVRPDPERGGKVVWFRLLADRADGYSSAAS
jgi:anti-sigma regulatory factor (Ser/Thr protein kinase)